VERQAPAAPIAETTHRLAAWVNASGDSTTLTSLHDRPAAAFCGLGNPNAFRRTLEQLGTKVIAWRTFPDHHSYSREDIESLRDWAREQPASTVVVTTQKDLVKIRLDRLADKELWALRIQLDVRAGQEELERKLSTLVLND